MRYLTLGEVLEIYSHVIQQSGGVLGIRVNGIPFLVGASDV